MNEPRRTFIKAALGAAASLCAAQPRPRLSRVNAEAANVLSRLSLEQKIGQMTQPDQQFLRSLDDIEKFHIGSLLSGGDSDPKPGNSLVNWTETYERLQRRAMGGPLKIPLLYGIDSVHGANNIVGAVIFPHNIGLGCTRNAKLVEQIARLTAIETRATGINWTFAPCVTAPQDIRWGRTYEGFSEDATIIAPLGAAATRGLQQGDLTNPLAVAACVKHFAGDGGTAFGTGMKDAGSGRQYPLDQGDTRGEEDELYKQHIAQYIPSIEAGAATIMPSYSSWNGQKSSGSKHLLTDILKTKLGFEGFLISDYNAVDQLPGNFKEQIALSINAGMDMVMVPQKYEAFYNLLLANAHDGRIPMTRIDDAVMRILRVKAAMGLMKPAAALYAPPDAVRAFGSAAHREFARQAVRESVVILKNDRRVLPLARSVKRIHVAGKNMDDVGAQCGGWTITWQGKTGAITPGVTVLQAITKAVSPGVSVTHSADGTGVESGTGVGIAVIGESPYAEFMGDRTELSLAPEDVAAVKNLKKSGIPVVAVIISGRPLVIDNILGDVDAVVAAWWPGSEGGAGIADILLGSHRPSGKLSFTWPAAGTTDFHRASAGYKVRFPLGYGLTW